MRLLASLLAHQASEAVWPGKAGPQHSYPNGLSKWRPYHPAALSSACRGSGGPATSSCRSRNPELYVVTISTSRNRDIVHGYWERGFLRLWEILPIVTVLDYTRHSFPTEDRSSFSTGVWAPNNDQMSKFETLGLSKGAQFSRGKLLV